MVAFALSEHWLEEEEFDDEDKEAFVLRFRFDRMSNLFLILVSGLSVGCWYGLACFFFLPPGGEKEFAKGGFVGETWEIHERFSLGRDIGRFDKICS